MVRKRASRSPSQATKQQYCPTGAGEAVLAKDEFLLGDARARPPEPTHGLFIAGAIALESLRHRPRRLIDLREAVTGPDSAIKVK
jgi:hypothetical protein